MYFENTHFDGNHALPKDWEEGTFKYCTFSHLNLEGGGFGGVMVGCVVEHSEWYWGLFNTATWVNVHFKNCTFRGTAFAGCSLTECTFTHCTFTKDNLNADCRFWDNRWYACTQMDCTGLTEEAVCDNSLTENRNDLRG